MARNSSFCALLHEVCANLHLKWHGPFIHASRLPASRHGASLMRVCFGGRNAIPAPVAVRFWPAPVQASDVQITWSVLSDAARR